MDEIRLESYSKVLVESFADDVDTLAALDKFSMTERGEFEPIIPPKLEMIRLVKREGWARKRAEREAKEQTAAKELAVLIEKEREEGLAGDPEWLEKQIQDAAERLHMDRKPKEIDTTPKLVCCPKCSFELPVPANLHLWDSKKLYEYAAMKEELELIADRNRAMDKLPMEDVVKGVA